MSVEDFNPAALTSPVHRAGESGIDWTKLCQRLEASKTALERRLTPGPEEKQKILRARAQSLAGAAPARKSISQQQLMVVEFVLGPEHYAIESSYIREIHPLHEFTPLPCTPAFVLGLVNIRGQILSIINIKKLFDLPEKGLTDLNKVVIVQGHGIEIGILADAILGVRLVASDDLYASLPTFTGIRAEYLKGITKESLAVLDMENILSDKKLVIDEEVNTTT